MGLDERDYMRDRYRKRQDLDPDGTTWNDKKARREQSRAAHKKAVPLGSASWVGKTIDMEPGSGGGAWFAAKNRGFDARFGRRSLVRSEEPRLRLPKGSLSPCASPF